MKKLFLLVIFTFITLACSSDHSEEMQYFTAPVLSVEMPDNFQVNTVNTIMVKYKRPTECHIFNGFYYDIVGNTRTVAVLYAKLNQASCLTDDTEYEVPLDFLPTSSGTYTFKFWTGTNDQGVDTYIEAEAIVGQ